MLAQVSNETQLQPIIIGISAEQFIKNFRNPKSNLIEKTRQQYSLALLNRQYPINREELKIEENKTYLDQIVANVSAIPNISFPPLELDDTVFHADTIAVLPDDSKGLKQDIYRFNRKIASWTCDHSNLRKTKLQYKHDILELFKSNDYKEINKYINDMASACNEIKICDNHSSDFVNGSTENDSSDDEDDLLTVYNDNRIDVVRAKKVYENALSFVGEIYKFQSKYQQTECPICARHRSEYQNMIDEVEKRRQDAKDELAYEIKKLQDSVDESMDEFMKQYFPGKNKLKLMDIVKMWKLVKKEMIKQDDIAGLLEETGLWKITNSHNIKYATKH